MAEPLKYAAIIERYDSNYGGYVPDLPGCGAVDDTPEEVMRNLRTALEIHLRSIREGGDEIPPPTSTAITIEVAP